MLDFVSWTLSILYHLLSLIIVTATYFIHILGSIFDPSFVPICNPFDVLRWTSGWRRWTRSWSSRSSRPLLASSSLTRWSRLLDFERCGSSVYSILILRATSPGSSSIRRLVSFEIHFVFGFLHFFSGKLTLIFLIHMFICLNLGSSLTAQHLLLMVIV